MGGQVGRALAVKTKTRRRKVAEGDGFAGVKRRRRSYVFVCGRRNNGWEYMPLGALPPTTADRSLAALHLTGSDWLDLLIGWSLFRRV